MNKNEQIAWKWIVHQPALGQFESRIYPVDFRLYSMLTKFSAVQTAPALEAIRKRSILYSKAGCPKDACVKASVRDYLEAIR